MGVTNKGRKDIDNCPVTGEDYSNVTWAEYTSKVKSWG